MRKRILSLALVVALIFGVFTVPARAAIVEGTSALAASALFSYATSTGVPLSVIEGGTVASSTAIISDFAAATGVSAAETSAAIAGGVTIGTGGVIILTAAAVALCAGIVAYCVHRANLPDAPDVSPVVLSSWNNWAGISLPNSVSFDLPQSYYDFDGHSNVYRFRYGWTPNFFYIVNIPSGLTSGRIYTFPNGYYLAFNSSLDPSYTDVPATAWDDGGTLYSRIRLFDPDGNMTPMTVSYGAGVDVRSGLNSVVFGTANGYPCISLSSYRSDIGSGDFQSLNYSYAPNPQIINAFRNGVVSPEFWFRVSSDSVSSGSLSISRSPASSESSLQSPESIPEGKSLEIQMPSNFPLSVGEPVPEEIPLLSPWLDTAFGPDPLVTPQNAPNTLIDSPVVPDLDPDPEPIPDVDFDPTPDTGDDTPPPDDPNEDNRFVIPANFFLGVWHYVVEAFEYALPFLGAAVVAWNTAVPSSIRTVFYAAVVLAAVFGLIRRLMD